VGGAVVLEPGEERANRKRCGLQNFGQEPPQPPFVCPESRGRAARDALGEQERPRSVREGVSIGFFAGF
jgi:hypothetical protein